MAASVVLHCSDGWSFLSHAVASMLSGDPATAVHLAYYAELRAAMSFLASEGIGVFDIKNLWVDGSSRCLSVDGRTHWIAWEALQEWAKVPGRSSRLLELLRVQEKSIAQWLTAGGYPPNGPASTMLARDWLQQWSIDLASVARDQYLRNEVSYRPQGLRSANFETYSARILENLAEFWRACEPSGVAKFELLDSHLLRQAFKKTFRIRPGGRPVGRKYEDFVARAFRDLGLSQTGSLYDFLCEGDNADDHLILQKAQRRVQVEEASAHPLSVVARGMLLLRLASAATENLLRQSSIGRAELEFWWDEMGVEVGLWEPASAHVPMSDLWEDVRDNLDAVDMWLAGNPTSNNNHKLQRDLPLELEQLKQFQRAGLWAIGL